MITLESQGMSADKYTDILTKILANIGQESNEQLIKDIVIKSELLNTLTIEQQLISPTIHLARHLAIETPQEQILIELGTHPHEIHHAIRYDSELQRCYDLLGFALLDLVNIYHPTNQEDIPLQVVLEHIAVINEQIQGRILTLSDEDMQEELVFEEAFREDQSNYFMDHKVFAPMKGISPKSN